MSPTVHLALATTTFLVTHFAPSTPVRPALVRAVGEWPYRGLYSLVAFATLGWMIWAYAQAPVEPLWPGLRLVPLAVMPFAFVLLACGYFRNPTMVGAEKLLASDDPARGVIRITRHPLMWAIMLWAASHVLARGDVASVIFFGGLFALAAIGTISMDSRKKENPDWSRFEHLTSNVPFVAIAQGRNRIVWREIGWSRPAIGMAAFVLVLLFHSAIFGAPPY